MKNSSQSCACESGRRLPINRCIFFFGEDEFGGEAREIASIGKDSSDSFLFLSSFLNIPFDLRPFSVTLHSGNLTGMYGHFTRRRFKR